MRRSIQPQRRLMPAMPRIAPGGCVSHASRQLASARQSCFPARNQRLEQEWNSPQPLILGKSILPIPRRPSHNLRRSRDQVPKPLRLHHQASLAQRPASRLASGGQAAGERKALHRQIREIPDVHPPREAGFATHLLPTVERGSPWSRSGAGFMFGHRHEATRR